jgi:hypothetical protein
MMSIWRGALKRVVLCAGLALTAALAVMTGGCGNPGEGTVHVGPKAAAKLGKHPGVPFADYAKNKVEPVGAKPRLRKGAPRK